MSWQDWIDTAQWGKCEELMPLLPDKSIHAIVTDPPYGLEFMGKEWDRFSGGFSKKSDWKQGNLGGLPRQRYRNIKCPECDKWIYAVPPKNCTCGGVRRAQMMGFEKFSYGWAVGALRVAMPGAYLLAFGGTRTFHRLMCAIEDAGWEIRDTIMWVYGSGFPKSHDVSKAIDKAAGQYVPGDVLPSSRNTGASASNIATTFRLKTSANPQTDTVKLWQGWGTALKPAWEPIVVARKPLEGTVAENVLKYGTGAMNIDGSRVKTDVPRPARENKVPWGIDKIGSENPRGNKAVGETTLGRWPANLIHDGSEEVMRGFPNVRAGRAVRHRSGGHTFGGNNPKPPMADMSYGDSGSAARFFYCAKASKAERGKDNKHPTVKPLKLMEYLVKLISRDDQIILDMFAGSGSTLVACKRLGRRFLGFEKDREDALTCNKRLERTQWPSQEAFVMEN